MDVTVNLDNTLNPTLSNELMLMKKLNPLSPVNIGPHSNKSRLKDKMLPLPDLNAIDKPKGIKWKSGLEH